jgi:hypothetical protein
MILLPIYTRTSVAGLLSFGIAALSSGIALFRLRNVAAVAWPAAWIAALESLLMLDMAMDARWALHGNVMQFALRRGFYAQRHGIQIAGLTILFAILLFGAAIITCRLRSMPGAIVAAWSALLALTMWCVELVSLHEIDAVLYHKVGGFMVIAFVWMILGATTAISIQLEASARNQVSPVSFGN